MSVHFSHLCLLCSVPHQAAIFSLLGKKKRQIQFCLLFLCMTRNDKYINAEPALSSLCFPLFLLGLSYKKKEKKKTSILFHASTFIWSLRATMFNMTPESLIKLCFTTSFRILSYQVICLWAVLSLLDTQSTVASRLCWSSLVRSRGSEGVLKPLVSQQWLRLSWQATVTTIQQEAVFSSRENSFKQLLLLWNTQQQLRPGK